MRNMWKKIHAIIRRVHIQLKYGPKLPDYTCLGITTDCMNRCSLTWARPFTQKVRSGDLPIMDPFCRGYSTAVNYVNHMHNTLTTTHYLLCSSFAIIIIWHPNYDHMHNDTGWEFVKVKRLSKEIDGWL